MQARIHRILEQISLVRTDLQDLSDAIWPTINHHDDQALLAGVAFKRAYNAQLAAFDQLAGELGHLARHFTAARAPAAGVPDVAADRARPYPMQVSLLAPPDRVAVPLTDEVDIRFSRPTAFRLLECEVAGLKSWRHLHEQVCRFLAQHDPQRFAGLPEEPLFQTRVGHRFFARESQELRLPMALPGGVYVEGHLSANPLWQLFRQLLPYCQIDLAAFTVLLGHEEQPGARRAPRRAVPRAAAA